MSDEIFNLNQDYDLLESNSEVIVDADILKTSGGLDAVESLIEEFHSKAFEEVGVTCFTEVVTNPENGLSVTTYERGGAIVVEHDDVNPEIAATLEPEEVTKIDESRDPVDDSATYAYEKDGIIAVSQCAPPKIG